MKLLNTLLSPESAILLHFGPNILLSVLFQNTSDVFYSFHVKDNIRGWESVAGIETCYERDDPGFEPLSGQGIFSSPHPSTPPWASFRRSQNGYEAPPGDKAAGGLR